MSEIINTIEPFLKIISYITIIITTIIIAIKILKTKYDKNNNNKLEKAEKEEMLKENYEYVMSFLKDSMKCIAKGIVNDTGCKLTTAEKLMKKGFEEITKQNEEIEKEIKEEQKNEN